MKASGNRSRIVLQTKVQHVQEAIASLSRLQTDRIDLYLFIRSTPIRRSMKDWKPSQELSNTPLSRTVRWAQDF